MTVVLSLHKIFLPEFDGISFETFSRKDDNQPFKAYWSRDVPPVYIQQLCALPTLYIYALYLSENKQRLVPLTA